MAAATMINELKQLGYAPVLYTGELVGFTYTIPHGRFKDKVVEIVLAAHQFPDIPPPGPNIKPFLLPINPQGGEHPYGGVHQRNSPTAEHQYWSRPFPGWDQTDKNMKVYLAFLRTLFDI